MVKVKPDRKFEKIFGAVEVRALDPYHKYPFDQPNDVPPQKRLGKDPCVPSSCIELWPSSY